MSFLEKGLEGMSEDDLVRLIRRTIRQEVPPIPAGVAQLADAAVPLVPTGIPTDNQVVTYDAATGNWTGRTITTATVANDGAAPGSSPTPTVQGGLGFLAIKWNPVANNDAVTYEVHVSTAGSGFTPGAGTKVAETPGGMAVIYKDAGGTDLVYNTDYWVKLIAKDVNGSASASAGVGPTRLDPAGTADILAGAITAAKLETILSLTSSLVAGTASAQRVEVGYGTDGAGNLTSFLGVRAFLPDGSTQSFYLDGASGNVYVKGRIDFGIGSRIEDDLIDLYEQPGSGFATPAVVQSPSNKTTGGGTGTASVAWSTPTTAGNQCYLVLSMADKDGTAPTPTTPTGWTLIKGEKAASGWGAVDSMLTYTYVCNTTAQRSGTESITLNDTGYWVLTALEVSGVVSGAAGIDVSASSEGSAPGNGVLDGAEAITATANTVVISVITSEPGGPVNSATITNSFTYQKETAATDAGSPVLRQTVMRRNVTATGTYGPDITCVDTTSSDFYCSVIFAVKAASAAADAIKPDLLRVRFYAKDVGGEARPYVQTDKTGPHALMPAGTICAFAAASPPPGWLLCYGQSLLRTDYPALFSIIGTTYGAVDGTHFTLPDLRGRVVLALDNMGGTDANRLTMTNTLGGSGGEERHTLTSGEVPQMTLQTTTGAAIREWATGQGGGTTNAVRVGGTDNIIRTDNGGGDTGTPGNVSSHENLPPYLLLNYIIKF